MKSMLSTYVPWGKKSKTPITRSSALLYTNELVKKFKARTVVRGVSIKVYPGEIVGLLGPNGAGKSTTFGMVIGLLRPDQGSVWYDGNEVTHLPMYKRAQLGISYLPQEPSVFRGLTVRQNLLAILEYQPGLSRIEREERADALLDDFKIAHVSESTADTLSGGERRRTEVARALVTKPRAILLDEPFAGVDPIAVADLQDTVRLLQEKNIAVLITDHNVRETLQTVDRAYVISEGRILVSGSPQEIVESPLARKSYLGDNFRHSV
jgi:lipopolysaccharide export system ATP-binding protein